MTQDLNFRQKATQKTIARFQNKTFSFGRRDCAKLSAFHLQNIGRPIVSLNKIPKYKSLIGGIRALEKITGKDNLLDVMDDHFPAWDAPAEALLGDIVAVESPHPIGAMMIVVGGGAAFGYSEDAETAIFGRLVKPLRAWRVL